MIKKNGKPIAQGIDSNNVQPQNIFMACQVPKSINVKISFTAFLNPFLKKFLIITIIIWYI